MMSWSSSSFIPCPPISPNFMCSFLKPSEFTQHCLCVHGYRAFCGGIGSLSCSDSLKKIDSLLQKLSYPIASQLGVGLQDGS